MVLDLERRLQAEQRHLEWMGQRLHRKKEERNRKQEHRQLEELSQLVNLWVVQLR